MLQGYYNDQGTLTLCLECMQETFVEGEEWIPFPKNLPEPDNCTECMEIIGYVED